MASATSQLAFEQPIYELEEQIHDLESREPKSPELHEQIRAAGFIPAQRDSRYRLVRTFDRVMTAAELEPTPIPTRLNGLPSPNFVPVTSL